MFKILFLGVLILLTLNAKYTNELIGEDSPYLLQHSHNPVNWYPWGEKAFSKAKKENKLIFLSIGYSTCHWCHVMERESFENESVAKILNKNYISIKVDREEYPHIDRYYQDIFVLMNRRSGGWPLTIVLTPDIMPFFSTTYMPPDGVFGRSGLKGLLNELSSMYKTNKSDVIKSANSVEIERKRSKEGNYPEVKIDNTILNDFIKSVSSSYDSKNKGIGQSPKFPHATTLDMLLDIYRLNGDKKALNMSVESLMAMSKGGIYDQIEGGFYRYSVDEMWMIPHFEKMLYTNAELIEAYANAYDITKEDRFKVVIKETIENINERFNKNNLFYSASDADSDGKEGKYFVFDYDKSENTLKKAGFSDSDTQQILNYFSIYDDGNFEHDQTNPYLSGSDAPKELDKVKMVLKANRQKKNYPFVDYKIQTSWNALFIKSLFAAGKVVDKKYRDQALKSLDKLIEILYINGTLYHQIVLGKNPKV
jgi:uncharacterized protein YyaL (SSP411 family)